MISTFVNGVASLSCDSMTFFIIDLVVTHPYNITHQLLKFGKKNQATKNHKTKPTHINTTCINFSKEQI
jgi:hypothetical protein